MHAAEGAADDSERWMLGDGLVDESIATRPALRAKWESAYEVDPNVRAIYHTMWTHLDRTGYGRGWWARAE